MRWMYGREESAFPSVPRSMQPPRGPGWLSPSRSSASPHSHATLHFQAQILRVFSILLKLGSWSQWKNGLRNHKMRSLMADGRWPMATIFQHDVFDCLELLYFWVESSFILQGLFVHSVFSSFLTSPLIFPFSFRSATMWATQVQMLSAKLLL